jgi:NAD(P)-dependent dehydrogenase (short-subunit alcohol dehydrogenase family)
MSHEVPDRYAGKVAVVTGGASGIGEAIVRRLLAEGASVVAGDINDERLEALTGELGDRFAGLHADVRAETDIEVLVAAAGERFGGLHVAFNVAGLGAGAPIVDHSEADWRFVLDVCLTGVFLAMKHEGRALAEAGGGAIVNVSSLNSEVPMFGGAAYCTAKAGVAMLSKCGALELAEQNIRVNAISPGLTDTPLTAMVGAVPGVRDAYMDRIPMRRAATPADIASACLYLGSDDAGYVSGTNLFVDGAWATSGYPDLRPYLAAMVTGA